MGDRHPASPPGLCFRAPPTSQKVKYKGCLFSSLADLERVRHHGVPGAVPFPTADWLGLVTLTVPSRPVPQSRMWLSHPRAGAFGDLTICHWDSLALALAVSLAR